MTVRARDIARFLDQPLQGQSLPAGDFDLTCVRPLSNLTAGALVFANRFDPATVDALDGRTDILALVCLEYDGQLACPHIVLANPRLAIARVVERFFVKPVERVVAPTARLGKNVRLGRDVAIGEYCVIGDDVVIGDGSVLHHHVVVHRETVIGSDCLVKSHAVLGEDGFGFDFDDQRRPIRIPHIGRVVIGDRVEIGCGVTVARATFDATVIGDDTKLDDHVHVAHNVRIGPRTLLCSGAEVSGSCTIGSGAWIGPSASILDKITLGDDCMVGLGAVVQANVRDNSVVAGSPAMHLRARFPRPAGGPRAAAS